MDEEKDFIDHTKQVDHTKKHIVETDDGSRDYDGTVSEIEDVLSEDHRIKQYERMILNAAIKSGVDIHEASFEAEYERITREAFEDTGDKKSKCECDIYERLNHAKQNGAYVQVRIKGIWKDAMFIGKKYHEHVDVEHRELKTMQIRNTSRIRKCKDSIQFTGQAIVIL